MVPLTGDYEGQRFVVRRAGRRLATPLLAALIVVETTDLLFALDSIPAVFAVTTDTFLVFTSNAFAVLGLRALYFLFAHTIGRFAYLKIGLAAVLAAPCRAPKPHRLRAEAHPARRRLRIRSRAS